MSIHFWYVWYRIICKKRKKKRQDEITASSSDFLNIFTLTTGNGILFPKTTHRVHLMLNKQFQAPSRGYFCQKYNLCQVCVNLNNLFVPVYPWCFSLFVMRKRYIWRPSWKPQKNTAYFAHVSPSITLIIIVCKKTFNTFPFQRKMMSTVFHVSVWSFF